MGFERIAVVDMVENQKVADVKYIMQDRYGRVRLTCDDKENGERFWKECRGEKGGGGEEGRGLWRERRLWREGRLWGDAEDSDTSRKVMGYPHDAREDMVGDKEGLAWRNPVVF